MESPLLDLNVRYQYMKMWKRIPINIFLTAFLAALSYVTLVAIKSRGIGFGEPFLGGFIIQVLFHAAFTLAVLAVIVLPIFVFVSKLLSNTFVAKGIVSSLLFVLITLLYSFILNEFWLGAIVPGIVSVVSFHLIEHLTTKSIEREKRAPY